MSLTYVFFCKDCNSKLEIEVDNHLSNLQSTIKDLDLDIKKKGDFYIYICKECER
jgi:transcription initiation factor IIE alpha subunit